MVGRMNLEPIIAAAVAGIFAFAGIVWQSRKTRRINTREHDFNATKLDRIEGSVERVATKVDNLSVRQDRHEDLHYRGKRKW
jgi:Flp pilus assembly protein TadB